ncbi:UvrD-helicase domain-containing protein [Lacrimispora sp.]|uniref:UvrD-helicase domain-containing protein n=1 Tax=Lacrimispora sp. TaxID=2719234 RepID=UPI0028A08A6B|nr:UvrD-helicase domain-containing protein [Lacrimispora sp.]
MQNNKRDELIAGIICDKKEKQSCEACYQTHVSSICKDYEGCRISQKTDQQLKYVEAPVDENIFLCACAGSGKTEVVGMKTAYEIKKWKNKNRGIAILTFTNDATQVISERVKEFVGTNIRYPHYVGTLSSFIHKYISQPFGYKLTGFKGKNGDMSFSIVDSTIKIYDNHWLNNFSCSIQYLNKNGRWQKIYANQIGYDINKREYYFYVGQTSMWLSEYYHRDDVQKYIKEKRRESFEKYWEFDYLKKEFAKCKSNFWKHGLATFDDMNLIAHLVLTSKEFSKITFDLTKKFPLIIVDECQDLSENELIVLKSLNDNGTVLHFVGDLNQSIYEFKRVVPERIGEYVKNFRLMELKDNFRSCRQIVEVSKKLMKNTISVDSCAENILDNALLYVEYETPENALGKYYRILDILGFAKSNNRILVKQNTLKNELEKSTQSDLDDKESLLVAFQLWNKKDNISMLRAMELAGNQISKWFGGGISKKRYFCPKEIKSVYRWRIFLKEILNSLAECPELEDIDITYGNWHELARTVLPSIIKKNYEIIYPVDEMEKRDLEQPFKGQWFNASRGNTKVKVKVFENKVSCSMPIVTIHNSKGCTYDTTLVISSKTDQSEGGHWKAHWIYGTGEEIRIGYVASTRAKHLLVWAVPKIDDEDRRLIESYGFINAETVLEK